MQKHCPSETGFCLVFALVASCRRVRRRSSLRKRTPALPAYAHPSLLSSGARCPPGGCRPDGRAQAEFPRKSTATKRGAGNFHCVCVLRPNKTCFVIARSVLFACFRSPLARRRRTVRPRPRPPPPAAARRRSRPEASTRRAARPGPRRRRRSRRGPRPASIGRDWRGSRRRSSPPRRPGPRPRPSAVASDGRRSSADLRDACDRDRGDCC